MTSETDTLRQMMSTIHSDLTQLRDSVDDVKGKVDDIQLQLAEQRGQYIAGKALRDKLENLPHHHELLKIEVENIKTAAIQKKAEEKEDEKAGKKGKYSAVVQLVESENGRRVIYWVLSALVFASLALGGSIATQDVSTLFRMWLGGNSPNTLVPVAQPVQPRPQLGPAPGTPELFEME
jgi:hypothetical protein